MALILSIDTHERARHWPCSAGRELIGVSIHRMRHRVQPDMLYGNIGRFWLATL